MESEVDLFGHRWPEHRRAFICDHIFEGEEVCIFFHEKDGDLVFLCGKNVSHAGKFKVAGLNHFLEHHPEIASIPKVETGQWAQREDASSEWMTGEIADDSQTEQNS